MAQGKETDWVEQGRYLPYHPRDLDPAAQLVEHPRDENGKETKLDTKGFEFPDPYVWFDRRNADGEHEVKRVRVPKRAMDRLRKLLDEGTLKPDHLSQLPLAELIPELAEHQGLLSGASRVPGGLADTEGGA